MNKLRLTLAFFSLFASFMLTSIAQAHASNERIKKVKIAKSNSSKQHARNYTISFAEYITVGNVFKATAALAIIGATAGTGTSLAMQLAGSSAAPTVATASTVGAGAGASIGLSGGAVAGFARWWYGI